MALNETQNLWNECLRHAKFWRNEVKRSFGETINHLEVVKGEVGFI